MANNDILVQSSFQVTQSNKLETKQQDALKAAPAKVVYGQAKSQQTTEISNKKETEIIDQNTLREEEKERSTALQDKVSELNKYAQNLNRSLQFSVDEDSGDSVVKVIDSETKELIRQIPSQEVLDTRKAIDKYRGVLLETKA